MQGRRGLYVEPPRPEERSAPYAQSIERSSSCKTVKKIAGPKIEHSKNEASCASCSLLLCCHCLLLLMQLVLWLAATDFAATVCFLG